MKFNLLSKIFAETERNFPMKWKLKIINKELHYSYIPNIPFTRCHIPSNIFNLLLDNKRKIINL